MPISDSSGALPTILRIQGANEQHAYSSGGIHAIKSVHNYNLFKTINTFELEIYWLEVGVGTKTKTELNQTELKNGVWFGSELLFGSN